MSDPRAPIFDASKQLGAKYRGAADVETMHKGIDRFVSAALGRRAAPPAAAPSSAPTATESAASGKPSGTRGPLAAIVGTIAATSLFATIPEDEGYKLAAYRDIAGIPTICFGDTKDVRMGMRETPEGCMRRLEAQLIAHAKPVMDCSPRLKEPGRDNQRAAAVSLAYNIGVGAYCRSTVDKRFDVANWRGGCDAILRFNKVRVGGVLRPVRGLTLRRQRERELCLKGLT